MPFPLNHLRPLVSAIAIDDDDDKDAEIVQAINSIKYIETPLYNPDDDNDVTKFSYALRKHITDTCNRFSFGTISQNCEKPFAGGIDRLLHFAKLTDLIDYGRTAFNLAIKVNIEAKVEEIKYKVPTKEYRLSDNNYFELSIGKRVLNSELNNIFDVPVYSANVFEPFGYINRLLINDFSRPSVIWGIDGDWMVNYIPEKKQFYPTDHCGVLRCKTDDINQYFLSYVLEEIGKRNGFKREFRASIDRIKSLSIKIPSKSLQQKIAVELQAIDTEALEAKKQIIELQEEITDIVSRVTGDSIKLGDIYKISSGGTPSRKKSAYWINGNIPWVTTTEVTNEIITSTNECITKLGLENSSAKIYPINSLIIAMYGQGATRGRTAKLGIEACTNQACAVLYEKKIEVETDFVWYYMQSQYEKLRSISHGSVRPNLNANDIANYEIPLPSLSEQKDIVDKIRTIEAKIASLKRICDGASARKEAVLHQELIEDDKDNIGITTEKTISIPPTKASVNSLAPIRIFLWAVIKGRNIVNG